MGAQPSRPTTRRIMSVVAIYAMTKDRSKFGEMSLKTLQNNFTDVEQSRRLLKLGLPADSADCYLLRNRLTKRYEYIQVINNQDDLNFLNEDSIPCWSVGRLIEIFDICASEYKNGMNIPRNHIILDRVLIEFLSVLQRGDMDFSKLED